MSKKVILAYSGGLDTSVIIPWLQENYSFEVIAVCVDVGQGNETNGLEEKALEKGASKFYLEDVKEEFVKNYAFEMLKSSAVYEKKYLLGTSIARPLIAKKLVDIAKKEGAMAICHGCTGKGNDQIRFELAFKALAPEIQIIAPWRIWNIKSRDDAVKYLKDRNLPVPVTKEDSYSRDRNAWHLSHEGMELENPEIKPDFEKILKLCKTPKNAVDNETEVTIEFKKGIPIKLNGEILKPFELLDKLNKIAGKNAVGIDDIVESRVVGMKSRGVYETPGGTVLYKAHSDLERICLDKQTLSFKEIVSNRLADIIYTGEWFTPLRESLSAFVNSTQQTVNGIVKLSLYKGNVVSAGVKSDYSLYSEDIASFETGESYDHKDADGFINLLGLSIITRAKMLENLKKLK